MTVRSRTAFASASFAAGTTSREACSSFAFMATGRTPLTEVIRPDSDSSPTAITPSSDPGGSTPQAESIESATGRSNLAPLFGISAGDRLTVILLAGRRMPAFRHAERTRSWASRTWALRNPTMVNCGRPSLISASTRTQETSRPVMEADKTLLNIDPPFRMTVQRAWWAHYSTGRSGFDSLIFAVFLRPAVCGVKGCRKGSGRSRFEWL